MSPARLVWNRLRRRLVQREPRPEPTEPTVVAVAVRRLRRRRRDEEKQQDHTADAASHPDSPQFPPRMSLPTCIGRFRDRRNDEPPCQTSRTSISNPSRGITDVDWRVRRRSTLFRSHCRAGRLPTACGSSSGEADRAESPGRRERRAAPDRAAPTRPLAGAEPSGGRPPRRRNVYIDVVAGLRSKPLERPRSRLRPRVKRLLRTNLPEAHHDQ